MSLEIKADLKQLPKGELLSVSGLPPIPNGGSITLSKEDEETFLATTGRTVKDALSNTDGLKVTGTKEVSGGGES